MTLFEIIAILLTLAALFSYINYRTIKLPTTIGVMLIALLFSLGLIFLGKFIPETRQWATELLTKIDFDETLLHGMLSFLLFAGALHVNINDLTNQYRVITGLATFGVLTSTFIVGTLTWLIINPLMGIKMSMLYCYLFGALISPTDPIAVLGILKTSGIPSSLKTKIAGESLFNDGIGVVIFLILLSIATGGHEIESGHIVLLFIQEAIGGAFFGFGAGYLTYYMLKKIDNYQVEVLITLALVTGGYALAEALHFSAPIAIVVAGLLIGNHGRQFAMSDMTRVHLDKFWELIDEVLNAVLFVLIGLEVMVISFSYSILLAGALAVLIVLAARFISVSVPILMLKKIRTFSPNVIKILTWGGLRGGISVALALSLPAGEQRQLILAITYCVVIFSILVQGLTIGKVVSRGSDYVLPE
ncbi:MAG: sodium:proton antiporter [Deltaproteobacteria bacterium]|jgi:CPA1 family monovalent cation:H+ antiporter|nr:sodium:proton antiporter [Deltaproteobacteria bacterium]